MRIARRSFFASPPLTFRLRFLSPSLDRSWLRFSLFFCSRASRFLNLIFLRLHLGLQRSNTLALHLKLPLHCFFALQIGTMDDIWPGEGLAVPYPPFIFYPWVIVNSLLGRECCR